MNYLSFNSLPYGKAYIFKGNSNKLAYLLQGEPNINVYTGDLRKALSILYFEPTNLVYLYAGGNTKLPEELIIHPYLRIFILFSVYDSLEAKEKALYSHYQSEYYTHLDYSSFTVKDAPPLSSIVEHYKYNSSTRLNSTCFNWDVYRDYPLTTQLFFTNNPIYRDLLELSEEYSLLESIPTYIKELAETKNFDYVLKLSSVSRTILSSYFEPPFNKFLDISGLDKLCQYNLYYWYSLFYNLYANKYSSNLNDSVYLFFLWVYRSSTFNKKSLKEGLVYRSYNKGRINKSKCYFNPSDLAVEEFYSRLIK